MSAGLAPFEELSCCLADTAASEEAASAVPGPESAVPERWMNLGDGETLPALPDEEGPSLPAGLPPVIDTHVHLFPDGFFEAIWRWFDRHGWPIRYKLHTPAVVDFLLSRGVERVVGLCYAHKPGISRLLNRYITEVAKNEPRVVPLGTVMPGESDAVAIAKEAFALGAAGLKLHCHVQCFAPNAPELMPVYEACADAGKVLVIHAGREPSSPHYACDPYALCSWERMGEVLSTFPKLRVVVPHLGADEFEGYEKLLERHDNLWLDTTMAVADYFPVATPLRLLKVRPERVMYGTDFPNLPYAWDREVKKLVGFGLGDKALALLLGGNARGLYGLPSAR